MKEACFLVVQLKRFGDDYCVSPEASILIHIGATAIPKQVTKLA